PGTWSTSSALATVSSTGLVTSIGYGTAIISYTSASTGCTTNATVTVNAKPAILGPCAVCSGPAPIHFTTLCGVGSTLPLIGTPAGGTWSVVVGPTVVSVSPAGIVTALAAGLAIVEYTAPNGCSETVRIRVNQAATACATYYQDPTTNLTFI